jgi:chloramphenicol 3-O phosphotransferase
MPDDTVGDASPTGRLGRILLLNGTSSSGKTTLVRALQARLADPWLEIGIDRFVRPAEAPLLTSRSGRR